MRREGERRERRDGDKKATERGRGQKQTPLIRYPQTNGMTVIKTLYMESMYVWIDPVADMHAGGCLVSLIVCVCEWVC